MKKIVSLIVCFALALCAFTACSGGKEEEKTADGYAKQLYLYNWSEYMSQEVLDLFEQEYGIKVVETTFESNDEMLAKLMAGNNGMYDIAVPSNFYIQAMVENGLVEEIDWNNVPNIENIDPDFRKMEFDPDEKYTVPYMGTVACWVANTDRLSSLGVKADSYSDLTSDKLKGEILMSDDTQGNISQGLMACGFDGTSQDYDQIQQAKEWLLNLNSNVKAYALPADVRDSMIRNEAAVAYMYSGNIVQAMEENDKIRLALNNEKISLSMDTFVILKGTKHKTEAELFLNFLLRPEISAKLIEQFPYVCFNKAAVDYLPENLANSPLVVLTDDLKNRIYMYNTFDGDGITYGIEAMTEVKTARG